MGEGPDEKVTTPAMPAVDPWARLDRFESSLAAHAERCAERFGEVKARSESAAEKCANDNAVLTRQIAASAGIARGLEGRVVEIEKWRPIVDAAVKRATADAAAAKQGAENSIQEMRGMRDGLISHLARSEATTLQREEAKKAEREDAAREAKAERDAAEARRVQATAKHEARFDAQGDAIKAQAQVIVDMSTVVTAIQKDVKRGSSLTSIASVVVGGILVVVNILSSKCGETVVVSTPARAVSSGAPQ